MANFTHKGGKVVLKDSVLFLQTKDSSNQLVSLALKFGDGNLTWEETDAYEYSLDRDKLDDVREGAEAPMSINFSGAFTHTRSTGSENPTPQEIIRARKYAEYNPQMVCADYVGYQESWLLDAGTCPPYSIHLELHVNPRLRCPLQAIPGEAFLFRFFRSETLSYDVNAGTISCSGKCNVLAPTVRRDVLNYTTFADAEPLTDWAADPRE